MKVREKLFRILQCVRHILKLHNIGKRFFPSILSQKDVVGYCEISLECAPGELLADLIWGPQTWVGNPSKCFGI